MKSQMIHIWSAFVSAFIFANPVTIHKKSLPSLINYYNYYDWVYYIYFLKTNFPSFN